MSYKINSKVKLISQIPTSYKAFFICFFILNFLMLCNIAKINKNSNDYFRLHVVAHSDSIEDQQLKLSVAKKVNDYIATLPISSNSDKNTVKETIVLNMQNILEICNDEIAKNNYPYPVVAKVGNIYYDSKTSNELYMPSGMYDSLQVIIGNGNGQNWWSLIYPNAYDGVAIYSESQYTKKDDTNHLSTSDLISSRNISIKFGIFESLLKLFK